MAFILELWSLPSFFRSLELTRLIWLVLGVKFRMKSFTLINKRNIMSLTFFIGIRSLQRRREFISAIFLLFLCTRKYLELLFLLFAEELMRFLTLFLLSFVYFNLVVYTLFAHFSMKGHLGKEKAIILSLMISSLPTIYFFHFLFYTDTFSLWLMILVYIYFRRGKRGAGYFYGTLAVLTRQTNIIWIVFLCVNDSIENSQNVNKKLQIQYSFTSDSDYFSYYLQVWKTYPIYLLRNYKKEFLKYWHYILIVAQFIAFLIWNGGIVLGMRLSNVRR